MRAGEEVVPESVQTCLPQNLIGDDGRRQKPAEKQQKKRRFKRPPLQFLTHNSITFHYDLITERLDIV